MKFATNFFYNIAHHTLLDCIIQNMQGLASCSLAKTQPILKILLPVEKL